ncbi:MAG: hypothetical protein JWR05_2308 [Mucilaginibacter sp.]|nr:hypothetical protein [Mucilaginibacter sp.]
MKKTFYLICVLSLFLTVSFAANNSNGKPNPAFTKYAYDEGSKIKLIIGDKTYELQSYNLIYAITDKSKSDLPPSNYFQTNNISFSIRSSKIDAEFINWILNPDQQSKDGQIIISDSETGKVTRTITFTGAKTNTYTENNYTANNINQYTNFSLKYKTLSIKL